MTEHWQLSGDAAELYQRYLVPLVTSKWAADLVSRAKPGPKENVLDVACGTGVVARLAATITAQGRVIGVDLNAGMLRVAQTLPNDDAQVIWVQGSALDLPFAANSFDLVLCQLGLQFFPDRERALCEMHRVLSASGRVALSVYGPIERTPGAHAFVLALDSVLGTRASKIKRGEHAFEHPAELRQILADVGFSSIEVQPVVLQITFPSVLDYVRFQLLATPMTVLLDDREDRGAAILQIARETERRSSASMLHEDKFSFAQEAFVATGRKHL